MEYKLYYIKNANIDSLDPAIPLYKSLFETLLKVCKNINYNMYNIRYIQTREYYSAIKKDVIAP